MLRDDARPLGSSDDLDPVPERPLNPASAIVEAMAALENAAGYLTALGGLDEAHRCRTVADRLHTLYVLAMAEIEDE